MAEPASPQVPEKPISSASIAAPAAFSVPGENVSASVREVVLGGSGTRTSSVVIGGAAALPFRHFEGNTGRRQVIAMEVFDKAPRNYPDTLREVYGELLSDPAKMAKYCVDELGAEVISVRLESTHPDNGDTSPEAAADFVHDILKAVGVPLIVNGPSNFDKMNAVMKQVASRFAGENLLLGWAETDNYKTVAAAAMGYGHCVTGQTPIDVNMAKQLNILMTNMGLAPEKIGNRRSDRCAGLRPGVYLLGSGTDPYRGIYGRSDARDADNRHAGLRSREDKGKQGSRERVPPLGPGK